jgi:hypothetical protein
MRWVRCLGREAKLRAAAGSAAKATPLGSGEVHFREALRVSEDLGRKYFCLAAVNRHADIAKLRRVW